MNVFAGAQIHHCVGAPFRRPTHFLDFFLDGRSHGAVADVGVDLYQEITADDHRLGFGMIDVCGNDGAAAGDFRPHEFGCYLARDVGTESFRLDADGEANCGHVRRSIRSIVRMSDAARFASEIFSDRDEFHLGRDDPCLAYTSCVTAMTSRCAKRLRREKRNFH